MQLFYAPDFTSPEYTLDEDESRHAVRVLRLRRGDCIHLTDGKGGMYVCRIVDDSVRACRVRVESVTPDFERRPYRLILAVAPTKNIDRFEWMLEKATEIGVDEIYPMDCGHSERHSVKADRENRVITSAVKQSLKAFHPLLHDTVSFRELVTMDMPCRKFIAHCEDAHGVKKYLASAIRPGEDVMVAIGPEGDFSAEEIRLALDAGFEEITLGCQRFRTETAAVVAADMVSIVNAMER